MSKKDKHIQRNPVFKGMMAGGNCKHQVIPDKKKREDDKWDLTYETLSYIVFKDIKKGNKDDQ